VTPGNSTELACAMCELLANPVRRAEMGQVGYDKMRHNYTWDMVTDRFRQVYTRVVGNVTSRLPQ
jgi:glycosyltransferase involved in cell wall biosynthesis